MVVRNARTGSTHLLGPFAAEVLRTLIEAGDFLGVEAVLSRLQARFPGDNDAEWPTAIPEVLSELERLRLVLPEKNSP
jgi:PqqD family protein of HPr-rel-A system